MHRVLIPLALAMGYALPAREGPVEADVQVHPGGSRIGAKVAVPLVRREEGALVGTLHASRERMDLDGTGVEVLGGSAALSVLRKSTGSLWFASCQVGLGAEPWTPSARSWMAGLTAAGTRRQGDSLRFGGGASLSLRPGEVGLHPFLVVLWRPTSTLELSGRPPARLSLAWRPAPAWETGGRWRLEGSDFPRADSSSRLRVQRLALEGFASRDLGTRLRLEATLGWLALNRLRRVEDGTTAWNIWGYDLAGARRSTVLENRPGPVARLELALRLPGD